MFETPVLTDSQELLINSGTCAVVWNGETGKWDSAYSEASINLGKKELKSIPFEFGNIKRSMDLSFNKITSLKNCPVYIERSFHIAGNLLTSIDYFPEYIGNSIYISKNPIKSLVGLPLIVHGKLFCRDCGLTNLIGCPVIVHRGINVAENPLVSIEGGPLLFFSDNTYNDTVNGNIVGMGEIGGKSKALYKRFNSHFSKETGLHLPIIETIEDVFKFIKEISVSQIGIFTIILKIQSLVKRPEIQRFLDSEYSQETIESIVAMDEFNLF